MSIQPVFEAGELYVEVDVSSFINMITNMVSQSGLSKYIANVEYRDGKVYLELDLSSLGIDAKQVGDKIRIKIKAGVR
jgi:heme oxygenase